MDKQKWRDKPISNKTIISIITAALLGVGSCEYALYKKFENYPNTIGKMMKWPFNDMYDKAEHDIKKIDSLYNVILESDPIEIVEGTIIEIEYIPRRSSSACIYSLISIEDGEKIMYPGVMGLRNGDNIKATVINTEYKNNFFLLKKYVDIFPKENYNFQWCVNDYRFHSKKVPYENELEQLVLTTNIQYGLDVTLQK